MRIRGYPRADLSRPPFLSWSRPRSYWDVVVPHLPLALVTGTALILPYLVSWDRLPLPACTFLSLTGYPCPFCGFTRSFWAMALGDWGFAIRNAPLSCLIYVITLILFMWHTTALLSGVILRSGVFRLIKSIHGGWLIAAMFLLNWIYRLASGFK